MNKYIKAIRFNKNPIVEKEKLSTIDRAHEIAAFKIRTVEGIPFSWFKAHTGFDFLELLDKNIKPLIKSGHLRYLYKNGIKSAVVLSEKGFLFCDEVSSSLL